jgi:hypothetical protein
LGRKKAAEKEGVAEKRIEKGRGASRKAPLSDEFGV